MSEAIIHIDGMSCQHCVMRVKKAIEELPGVGSASVEIGQANVTFDESKVSRQAIDDAIIKAGYKLKT